VKVLLKKKQMNYTTIANTLFYFHDEYKKYRDLNEEQQAICAEYNTEIQKSLQSAQTLRQLYIDLAICDEMLSAFRNISKPLHMNEKEKANMVMLFAKKKLLQKVIKERETLKECIIPDPTIESKLDLYRKDLKAGLCQSLPELAKKIEHVWSNLKENKSQQLIDFIMKEQMRYRGDIERYRHIVQVIECLILSDINPRHESCQDSDKH